MHKQIWLPVLIYSADVLAEEDDVVRADGFFLERHSAFVGSLIAFFIIAAQTGSDEILPGVFSAAGFRMNVINGQTRARSAVLALMPVAAQNIFARENDFFEGHMDKMRELDDAGELHRRMSRAYHFAGGNIDNIRLAHEYQDNCFLDRADREWLVVAVEE